MKKLTLLMLIICAISCKKQVAYFEIKKDGEEATLILYKDSTFAQQYNGDYTEYGWWKGDYGKSDTLVLVIGNRDHVLAMEKFRNHNGKLILIESSIR